MIDIVWDEFVTTISEPDPHDSWDRGDTQTEISNVRAKYVGDKEVYFGMQSHDTSEYKPGDTIFVTLVQYSTGDTFGHDAGSMVNVLGIFKNWEDALELQYRAENHNANVRDGIDSNYQIEYQGKTIYVGWTGYFESLDRVWVETLTVQA